MDTLLKLASINTHQKQLEEEFGLRTRNAPLVIEHSKGEDANRCCKVMYEFSPFNPQVSTYIIFLLLVALAAIVLCHQYLAAFLFWLARLDTWHGPVLFCLLFVLVSFPMAWGYIILNLGAGYIYGFFPGLLLTILGANLGALVSFFVCRRLWKDYVLEKLSTYDNLKQVVRVIEGRQGFKIILMTRLTPVPFGLQNALFSVS